jgi:hypothetical protein
MKNLVLLITLTICNLIFSQENFNYSKQFNKILQETKDAKSDFYYNKQLAKFNTNDTLQSNYEMLSLLIGYTANKNYKPYSDLYITDDLFKLNEAGKYQQVVEKAEKLLLKNPFQIKVLIEMGYALNGLGKTTESKNINYKMFKIYNAMLYSCDNNPAKYPAFALAPKDGQYFIKYFLRQELGTMGSGYDENKNFIDILETKKDGKTYTYKFILEHAKKELISKMK